MSSSIHKVFLLPGDYYVGDERCHIWTLLGSCVSITLWHPAKRIGAMSHFLLGGRSGDKRLNGRYGEDALELMQAGLRAKGVDPHECEGKIFGGGAMFTSNGLIKMRDIGRSNGDAARAMLLERGIPITSESLFGTGYRKIMLNVRTGDVWMQHVALNAPTLIATRKVLDEAQELPHKKRDAKLVT